MEEWQKRLLFEKVDLDDKINKLSSFMETMAFADLPDIEKSDLRQQSFAMRTYSDILMGRISRIER